ERTGIDPRFRRDGTTHAALDERELRDLERAAAALAAAGVDAELLDRASSIACEPLMSPATAGALRIPAEAQVDNRRLGRALLEAVRRAGVRVEAGCGDVSLDADE